MCSDILEKSVQNLPVCIHKDLLRICIDLHYRGKVTEVMIRNIRISLSYWPSEILTSADISSWGFVGDVYPNSAGVMLEVLPHLHIYKNLKTIILQNSASIKGLYLLLLSCCPTRSTTPQRLLNCFQEICESTQLTTSDETDLLDMFQYTLRNCDWMTVNSTSADSSDSVIDIVVDLVVSLGDWMHIAEEVILLLLKNATRYKITVTTITVNSYHINHAHRMNCLIQLLETGVTTLESLAIYGDIYGENKGMELLMHNVENLRLLTNLKRLVLGSMIPKLRYLGINAPSPDLILQRRIQVISGMEQLEDILLTGLMLGGQIPALLQCLHNPLKMLKLFNCDLKREDILFLSTCNYFQQLTHLDIERNSISDCGKDISVLVQNTPCLQHLNLRDTQLELEDKLRILTQLSKSPHMKILSIYDTEQCLPVESYSELVRLACDVTSLQELYICPFYNRNEAFEHIRADVSRTIENQLEMLHRNNLSIFY